MSGYQQAKPALAEKVNDGIWHNSLKKLFTK